LFSALSVAFIRKINGAALSDAELLEKFKSGGDAEWLVHLYDRYIELVFAVCIRYLGDTETSKDAVMDIYESLAKKLERHQVNNFRSWLYTVARNHCLMQLRGQHIPHIPIDDANMQSADGLHHEEVVQREAEFKWLESCMQSLSTDQKRVIALFYLQQKCYNDICSITGFAWNKVRSLVQNGRRNLKMCMEKEKQYESR